MPLNAAQLMVNIGGNPAGALTAISAVSGELGKGGKLGLAALGVGAIVAGVGIASVAMAGNFQKGMTSIVTGAGESKDKLQMLSQGVLQMARDTGTSTSQLVSGLYMIESGGYRGSQALEILRNAAEGAKVGNADLGTVADATDTILKNFSDTGLTSAQAVNTLIATVAHGKTHMEDLAASLSQVLPTGAAAKIGLNDVMGAMATMTGEGVPAAEAATYLRQTIIALMAPSAGSRKALEDIGLTTQQVSDEMHKSLPGALQLIHDHLVKKFPEGSAAYVAAMREIAGGSKQMQGMLDLGGSHLKAFADNTKTVADAAKHGGSQITGWSLVQKTFNLQFDRAKEVAQTLMIQLGQKLLPVATQLFGFIADKAIPALQNMATFLSGNSTQAQIIRPILIGLGIAIAGALVAAFVSWAIAAGAAAVATIAATWPILAIGAGIALLVAGIIFLVTHIKQLVAWFMNLATPLKVLIVLLALPLAPIILLVGGIILLVTHIKQVGEWIGRMAAVVRTGVENVLELLSHVPGPIGMMAGSVLNGMKLADDAVKIHTKSMQVATEMHTAAMAAASAKHLDTMRQNILRELEHTTNPAKRKALEMKLGVVTHAEEMEKQASAHAAKLAREHAAQMAKLAADAKARAADAKLGVLGHLGQMKDNALKSIGTLVTNGLNKLGELKDKAIKKAQELATDFMNGLTGLPGKLLKLGEDLLKQLAQGLRNGRSAVMDALKNIPVIGGLAGSINNLIPKFAAGGTMAQSGLALVGENGPEMVRLPGGAQVSPLSRLPSGSGGFHGGGSGTIVVQVHLDGRVVARSVARHLPSVIRNATGERSI